MQFDDKILEFLVQPDNLPVALQVADRVNQLKKELHRYFWQQTARILEKQLAGSLFANSWYLRPLDVTKGKLTKAYTGCQLHPNASRLSQGGSWLCACLHQTASAHGYALYYGFKWIDTPPSETILPELLTLEQEMKVQRYRSDSSWPGWRGMNYHIYQASFLLRLSQEPDVLIDEVVAPMWQMFTHYQPLVETIHQALNT